MTDQVSRGDADAYYVRGVAELAAGDPKAAAESLRRALYLHPTFALAAFKLGRAYDVLGNADEARRAYARAERLTELERSPT